MRIATWNVNSVRQRLDSVVAWLGERQPDVVCLQEVKCETNAFPREPFEALGYNVAVHGQKTFNGVALLSKYKFDEVAPGLGGDEADVQARFLEACISTKTGVDAGDLSLSAEWQPAGFGEIHLQARLDGPPDRVLA